MSRMSWQRCPACGRLNLARAGSTAACQCGAAAGPPRLGAPAQPPSLPAGAAPSPGPVGDYSALPRSDRPAGPATPSAPRRLTMITPEQDAVARALLASALGEDWTF